MVRNLVSRLLLCGLACATVSCAGAPGGTRQDDVRAGQNPADRAQRTITSFTPALRCMDDMMFRLGTRDVSVMMEEFRDATQRVPFSGRDMLTSALADMTRRSRGVKLTVFGTDQQNLTQLLQLAQKNSAFGVVPEFNIRGNLSQLDESVQKTGGTFGVNLLESLFGARFGSDTKFSVLGLDAAVVQTATMTLVPGVSSKNSTVLAVRDTSAGDGNAKLLNPAVGLVFSFATSRADGPAQAARNMIELASVELVGKLIRAPYWQCLGTPDSDPEVQREMDDWFFSMDDDERIKFFQERLRERRYYDGAVDGEASPALETALRAYRAALGLDPVGKLDEDFFKRFVTAEVPRGPLQRPRKPAQDGAAAASAAALAESPDASASAQAKAPPALVLRRTAPGAQLRVEIAQPGYLYCYSQDPTTQRIQRIYPNRFVKDPRVEPGKPVLLPGKSRFRLNPAAGLACLHAPREVYGDLPPPLRWGDFEDVNMSRFDDIRSQFQQAGGVPVSMVTSAPVAGR